MAHHRGWKSPFQTHEALASLRRRRRQLTTPPLTILVSGFRRPVLNGTINHKDQWFRFNAYGCVLEGRTRAVPKTTSAVVNHQCDPLVWEVETLRSFSGRNIGLSCLIAGRCHVHAISGYVLSPKGVAAKQSYSSTITGAVTGLH